MAVPGERRGTGAEEGEREKERGSGREGERRREGWRERERRRERKRERRRGSWREKAEKRDWGDLQGKRSLADLIAAPLTFPHNAD